MLTLFTKPDCPACAELKAWLEGQGFQHEEVNVYKRSDAAHLLRYRNLENPGKLVVPAMMVNGQVLYGFTGGEREQKWLEENDVQRAT